MLNESGSLVARNILAGAGQGEVASLLARTYGVAVPEARRQVRGLARELAEKGWPGKAGPDARPRRIRIRSLFLHLTDRCNLTCAHCYLESAPARRGQLPGDKVLSLCRELEAVGGDGVTLSGGEPLLHPDFRALIDGIGSGMRIQLLTNGILLTAELARLLSRRGIAVQVSLDGTAPGIHDRMRGHGAFAGAMQGVERLAGEGARGVVAAATVTRANWDDLDGLPELCRQRGVSMLRFLPLRRLGRGLRRWEELRPAGWPGSLDVLYERLFREEEQGRWGELSVTSGLSGLVLDVPGECGDAFWCPLGTTLAVDTRGDAYPCPALMRPAFRVGNVMRQSLGQIQDGQPLRRVVDLMAGRRERIAACRACHWKPLCQAGCMAMAVDQKGSVWETDYHCGLRKRLFPEAFARVARGAGVRGRTGACR
jgi:radical SAM protein with 4Fe4S-binding SPASM domain